MINNSFHTDRLTLTPTSLDDAAFILKLMNTTDWIANIGDRHIHSLKDAEEYIRKNHLPQLDRLGFSSYTVRRNEDEAVIGSCSLFDRDFVEEIEIGFAFLPEYYGKGYAYESAARLLIAAKEEFGFPAIEAITIDSNIGSKRLLEKLGLHHVRTIILPQEEEEQEEEEEEVMVYRVDFE